MLFPFPGNVIGSVLFDMKCPDAGDVEDEVLVVVLIVVVEAVVVVVVVVVVEVVGSGMLHLSAIVLYSDSDRF